MMLTSPLVRFADHTAMWNCGGKRCAVREDLFGSTHYSARSLSSNEVRIRRPEDWKQQLWGSDPFVPTVFLLNSSYLTRNRVSSPELGMFQRGYALDSRSPNI